MNILNKPTRTEGSRKRLITVFPLLAMIALFFSACLDDDDNNNVQIVAAIASINASPNTAGYDFYTDANSIVNTEQDFEYGNKIRYKNFYSGNRRFGIFQAGTTTNPLLDSTLTIKSGEYHTLFIADVPDKLSFVLLDDNLAEPATGKVKIRFVNLTPDAAALSLGIKGATGLLVSNKKFKEFSDFQEVDAGDIVLQVTDADNTVLREFTLKAEDGFIYTIYTKGFLDTDETAFPFGTEVIDHDKLFLQ